MSILQKYDAAAQEIKALELKVEEATAKETDSMREREQLSAALEEAKQRVAAETERASACAVFSFFYCYLVAQG